LYEKYNNNPEYIKMETADEKTSFNDYINIIIIINNNKSINNMVHR